MHMRRNNILLACLIFSCAMVTLYSPSINTAAADEQDRPWLRGIGLYTGVYRSEAQTIEHIQRLKRHGVAYLIPSLSGGGTVLWKSDTATYYPPNKDVMDAGFDGLASLIEHAHAAGMKVIPSVAIAPAGAEIQDHLEWETRDRHGRPSSQTTGRSLAFSYPEARAAKIAVLMDLVEGYDIDGVMVDYLRYPENSKAAETKYGFYGYDEPLIAACQALHGFDPRQEPIDSPRWNLFNTMRAQTVTTFLREFRQAVRDSGCDIPIVGFAGGEPDGDAAACGRDWVRWSREGLTDAHFFAIYPERIYEMAPLIKRVREAVGPEAALIVSLSPFMRFLPSEDDLVQAAQVQLAAGADSLWIYRHDAYEDLGLLHVTPRLNQVIRGDPAIEASTQAADLSSLPPLHQAAWSGDLAAIQQLLAGDSAAIDATDQIGATVLHVAAQQGHDSIVTWLVDQGANVNAIDAAAWTPLHLAARFGHASTVAILLDHGANIHATEHRRTTPLHFAAVAGHAQVVALLLDRGASANAKDWRGHTPAQLATLSGQ